MIKKFLSFAVFCMALAAFPYQAPASEIFTDVPLNHWAAGTIKLMAEKDMISGYGDGKFCPDSTVTRAEFAAMMVNAAGLKIAGVNAPSFVDVLLSHWGLLQVEAAKNFFNYTKTGEGLFFRPDVPILREEAAAALTRAKGLEKQKNWQNKLKKFNDYAEFTPVYGPDIAPAIFEGLIDRKSVV